MSLNLSNALAMAGLLVLGSTACGQGNNGSGCPEGLIMLGDRCVAFDAGRADGCLAEESCNGLDDDCDGEVDEGLDVSRFYADMDGDEVGDRASLCEACDVERCDEARVWVMDDGDCDDTCPTCYPGAAELCDNLDNDCDSLTDENAANTYYVDTDGDGYGLSTGATCAACDIAECDPLEEGSWVMMGGDCNDDCESCYPDHAETCDGLDNDCDGVPDNGVLQTFYRDSDGDGHGDVSMPCQACDAAGCGEGAWVSLSDDCNDGCATCLPGGTEVCDSLDNDCDGVPDDGLQNSFYRDADRDGYGVPTSTMIFCGTSAPAGWSDRSDDCADGDARAHPGAGSYGTPIIGAHSGPAFDFDCDGSETYLEPLCSVSGQQCGLSGTPRLPHAGPDCRQTDGACGVPTMVWQCTCRSLPFPGSCSSSTNMGAPAQCH